MNTHLLHHVLRQFRVRFLAFFRALTKQDYRTLLTGESETLLYLLQQRYGYTSGQAKAAWNEFILRYVDGRSTTHPLDLLLGEAPVGCLTSSRLGAKDYRWLHCTSTGVPAEWQNVPKSFYH